MIRNTQTTLLVALSLTVTACAPSFQEPPKNLPIPPTFKERQFLDEQASSIIQDDLSQVVDVAVFFDQSTRKITLGGPIRTRQGTTPPGTVVRLENKPPIYSSAITNQWDTNSSIPFLNIKAQDSFFIQAKIQDIARLAVDKGQTPTQAQLMAAAGTVPTGQQIFWSRGALLTRIENRVFRKINSSGSFSGYGAMLDGSYFSDSDSQQGGVAISLFLVPLEILPTAPVPSAPPQNSLGLPARNSAIDDDEPIRLIPGAPPGLIKK